MTDEVPRARVVADPTPVIIRHVRRALAGETAVSVLQATFTAAESGALNAAGGWQSGEVRAMLNGDGSFTVRLPNDIGRDGLLHRERFAVITDPNHRLGEEWIEVYREPMGPNTLLMVGTTQKDRSTTSEVVISGPDLTALYTLARASSVDLWRDAPRDVWEHYTRLRVFNLWRDFVGWAIVDVTNTTQTDAQGWEYRNVRAGPVTAGGVGPAGGVGEALNLWAMHPTGGTNYDAWIRRAPTRAITSRSWIADVRCAMRFSSTNFTKQRLEATYSDGTTILFDFFPRDNGRAQVSGTATVYGAAVAGSAPHAAQGRTQRDTSAGGWFSMRLIARGAFVYAFLEGELVARARLAASTVALGTGPTTIRMIATDSAVDVYSIVAESLEPFGLRGTDKGDLFLPGLPSSGGLRGRYYNTAAARSAVLAATIAETEYRRTAIDPLDEPDAARLDLALDFAVQAVATWQPPATQAPDNAFGVVWTGSIYLDLSVARVLRVTGPGRVRVFVGKTGASDAVIDIDLGAGGATASTGDLRTHLAPSIGGAAPSGWYPIRIEYSPRNDNAGFKLEVTSGAGFATVPPTQLSPSGCFEDEVRGTAHREILDRIAEQFGYQWRVEYRSLESGEFPGQIPPRVRVGWDSDYTLPTDDATDLAAERDAADAVDVLQVDAAGIADPKGAEQLSAEAINFATAGTHLFVSTGAESLAETTEENALALRAESLLALRSGPNETVAARPPSTNDEMRDTFPITGALARLKWRPGDGLRLALGDLSVVDLSARQMLSVGWAIYPDGTAPPIVAFRQRPRGVRSFLRRVSRAAFAPRRAYQGQSARLVGGIASVGDTSGQDATSRLAVAAHEIVDLELVVLDLTAGATATLVVNGTNTGVVVRAADRYPVGRWAQRTAKPLQTATVTGLTAGAAITFALRARIRL